MKKGSSLFLLIIKMVLILKILSKKINKRLYKLMAMIELHCTEQALNDIFLIILFIFMS